jgi:hypothetical protein
MPFPCPHVGTPVGAEADRALLSAPLALAAADETAPGESARPDRPQPAGRDIREVIADLNPLLRGRGNYFRTENAAVKFRRADRYLVGRLRTLMVKKRARTCTLGRPTRGQRTGSTGTGSTGFAARSAIRGQRNHARKIIGKLYAGKPHARIERGMGKRACIGTAPLTTNGHCELGPGCVCLTP